MNVITLHLLCTHPLGKRHQYPLDTRMGWLRCWSECGVQKNIPPPSGNWTLTIQPADGHFTGPAILAESYCTHDCSISYFSLNYNKIKVKFTTPGMLQSFWWPQYSQVHYIDMCDWTTNSYRVGRLVYFSLYEAH